MSVDITSIFDTSNSIDRLVDMYIRMESQPRNKVAQKRETLYDRKKVLSNLDSKLSALNSKSERLIDDVTDYLVQKNRNQQQ